MLAAVLSIVIVITLRNISNQIFDEIRQSQLYQYINTLTGSTQHFRKFFVTYAYAGNRVSNGNFLLLPLEAVHPIRGYGRVSQTIWGLAVQSYALIMLACFSFATSRIADA